MWKTGHRSGAGMMSDQELDCSSFNQDYRLLKDAAEWLSKQD
jgi:hypothetical protein